jgi:hypothetical protein
MFNLPIDQIFGLVFMLTLGIAAVSVLVWAVVGMTCGFLDDDKGTMQPPSRAVRR